MRAGDGTGKMPPRAANAKRIDARTTSRCWLSIRGHAGLNSKRRSGFANAASSTRKSFVTSMIDTSAKPASIIAASNRSTSRSSFIPSTGVGSSISGNSSAICSASSRLAAAPAVSFQVPTEPIPPGLTTRAISERPLRQSGNSIDADHGEGCVERSIGKFERLDIHHPCFQVWKAVRHHAFNHSSGKSVARTRAPARAATSASAPAPAAMSRISAWAGNAASSQARSA